MQVEQILPGPSVPEETSSALRCNFSITVTNVQWFLKNPGGNLIRLFSPTPGTNENGKFKSTSNSKEQYSNLPIGNARLQNSGNSLCTNDAQCSQHACGLASATSGCAATVLTQEYSIGGFAQLWGSQIMCIFHLCEH
ncbi:hypothetical protein U0070_027569 [Myodes glareolus]|uniref:Ig-like domain-containing protein n=1 Tax=Myodes glareolus TaxID=447135 RepID=A0AAW0GZ59_MYOGA